MKQEDKVKIMEDIEKKKAIKIIDFLFELLKEANYRIIDVLYKNVEKEKDIMDKLKEAHAVIDIGRDLLKTLKYETKIVKWLEE